MAKKKVDLRCKQLRAAMLDNLQARGLVEQIYTDKVEEYITLWRRHQQLQEDITERGVVIHDPHKGVDTENRSVSLSIQVSRQMLSVFTALGFKDIACSAKAGDGEDDEL